MMQRKSRRLYAEQGGFTLTEMMVTIMVMLVVMFALYSIFDMSIRIFTVGNNKVETTQNARLGLEKMEREVRAAYPEDKAGGDGQVLSEWTAVSMAFGNDLNGSQQIECGTPCETIRFQVYQPTGSSTYALGRSTGGGSLQPVVEYVDYVSSTDTGLSIKYYKNDGTQVSPGVGSETEISRMQIALRIAKGTGDSVGSQTLTTDVSLRNRVGGIAPPSAAGGADACSNGLDDDGDAKTDYPSDPGCEDADDSDEADPPPAPDCGDGVDNDSDGETDYPADPGCSTSTDPEEADPLVTACSNGIDDDGDTKTDHPADPGCSSTSDTSEVDLPRCSDGADNDGDSKTDYPDDPGCTDASDVDETDPPACSNGRDDDGDGKIDHPADLGCISANDTSETDEPACNDGRDNDGDSKIDYPNDPGCSSAIDNNETDNRKPVAADDTVSDPVSQTPPVKQQNYVDINVRANDSDPDGDPITVSNLGTPTAGTVTLNADGSIRYTAGNGNTARGTHTFEYTISDGNGGTAKATVTVTVVK